MIDLLRSFLRDRDGNYAMIFGLMIVPLVGAVGLTVDYTHAMNVRASLQNAADTAVLTLARAHYGTLSDEEAHELAGGMLAANFSDAYKNLQISRDGNEWQLSVTAVADNPFAMFKSSATIDMQIESRAAFSDMSYEIALVLDTTGSMEGDKLADLKSAAKAMVETMTRDITDRSKIRFSLVPFSTFVNVGPQHAPTFNADGTLASAGASWLDTWGQNPVRNGDLPTGLSRFQLYHLMGKTWPGCVETRDPHNSIAYDTTLAPATGDPRSLFVPTFHLDDYDGYSARPNNWLSDSRYAVPVSYWAPAAEKRLANYGVPLKDGVVDERSNWRKPVINDGASRYYSNYSEPMGPGFFCDSQPVVPLTTDYDKILTAIDGLLARGNTNIFEGMMWGWRTLDDAEPFTEGRPRDAHNNEKIVILLTDGNNAWNRMYNPRYSSYSSFGYLTDQRLVARNSNDSTIMAAMDAQTLAGCTNAKADDVTIYTIRLELQDSNSAELMRDCATDPDHFFDVPDSSTLESTFEEIRHRINRVRITS
jgi:Flp pilus assembly protein TadG